jgi:hypothetical protein
MSTPLLLATSVVCFAYLVLGAPLVRVAFICSDVHLSALPLARAMMLSHVLPRRLQPLLAQCFPAALPAGSELTVYDALVQAFKKGVGGGGLRRNPTLYLNVSGAVCGGGCCCSLCAARALAQVIRYDGAACAAGKGPPQHQPTHADFSLLSANLALSAGGDFDGGGTHFEWAGETVNGDIRLT